MPRRRRRSADEESAATAAGGAGGRRLSREVVVDAAIEYIDQHGNQTLTMRRLGDLLNVEAMALYRYVTGREDLLEAVIARLLSGLPDDLDPELVETWQGYLQSLAHAVRRIAVEHPGAFPLVATRHPAAPWLRPPLRSLELVEDFLSTLVDHGFSDQQAVETYRAFSSFLLGTLLLDAAQRGAETSPVEVPLDEGESDVPNKDGQVDLADSPTIVRVRTLLSEDHSDEEFVTALETLLDRMELSISQ